MNYLVVVIFLDLKMPTVLEQCKSGEIIGNSIVSFSMCTRRRTDLAFYLTVVIRIDNFFFHHRLCSLFPTKKLSYVFSNATNVLIVFHLVTFKVFVVIFVIVYIITLINIGNSLKKIMEVHLLVVT